jgi:hypothetical protein
MNPDKDRGDAEISHCDPHDGGGTARSIRRAAP